MGKIDTRNSDRKRRHERVRDKVIGTSECPRMVVFRSLKHIYAQVIDDMEGKTIVSASTLEEDIKPLIEGKNSKEIAFVVGEQVGKKVLEKGVKKVIFDRGGYKYHGRIAELANGARSAGLEF